MATKNNFDDDRYWSDETCLLKEIPQRKLPVLVKVNEDEYYEEDCDSFSRGDVIKIDFCQHLELVQGFVAKWKDNGYNKTGTEVAIPLHYEGLVNVLPMKGVAFEFTSVNQLMQYFPKKVRTGFEITFEDFSGENCTLLKNEVLEILTVVGDEKYASRGLLVRRSTSDIILPRSLKGSFITVSHDRQYTIKDVMTFQMPLCIRFVDQDFDLTVTKSFLGAAANVKIFQREVILTGKIKKTTVLYGHYKVLDPAPLSTVRCSSAIILSLDNEDIANIEVQFSIDMDEHDYEDFVLHHFSKTNTKQSVEGLLYFEFVKGSGVCFIEDTDFYSSLPICPPRPWSDSKEETETKLLANSEAKITTFPVPVLVPVKKRLLARSMSSLSRLHIPGPLQLFSKYKHKEHQDTTPDSCKATSSGMNLIGDSFTSRTAVTEKDKVEYRKALNKLIEKSKIRTISRLFTEQKRFSEYETQFYSLDDINNEMSPVENDEHVYDEIDVNFRSQNTPVRHFLKEKKDKFQKIFTGVRTKPKIAEKEEVEGKDFVKMSVYELEKCFSQCGMPKLGAICHQHTIDGELFTAISRDQLKEEPFLLTAFEITKVEKILQGCRSNE